MAKGIEVLAKPPASAAGILTSESLHGALAIFVEFLTLPAYPYLE
jgi:hypothetical protein